MNRSRPILVLTVLLVLGAGLVLGRVSARLSAPPPPPLPPPSSGAPHSWLADQLNLTPDQRQKMDGVWAETKTKMDESFDKRRALDRDREQAMIALLDEQQHAAYDEILAEHRIARAELDKERESIIKSANDRSRQLLSDSQKQRWDTLTKEHPWHGRGPGGHPTSGPSSRPVGPMSFGRDPGGPPPSEFTNSIAPRDAVAPQTIHTRPAATEPE